jgi:chromosome segregation ATPase
MWGNFANLNLKDLADKAKAAAEHLDKQLNESVGMETPAKESAPNKVDMEGLDDAWGDDDDDNNLLADNDHEEMEKEATQQETAVFQAHPQTPTTIKEEEEKPPTIRQQQEPIPENGWEDEVVNNLQFDEPLQKEKEHAEAATEEEAVNEEEKKTSHSDLQPKHEQKQQSPNGSAWIQVVDDSLVDAQPGLEHVRDDDEKDDGKTAHASKLKDEAVDFVPLSEEPLVLDDIVEDPDHPQLAKMENNVIESVVESVQPVLETGPELSIGPVTVPSVPVDEETTFAGTQPNAMECLPEESAAETETITDSIQESAAAAPLQEVHQQRETQEVAESHLIVDISNNDVSLFNEQLQQLQAKLQETQMALQHREEQLMNKTEQLTEIESMHEKEKEDLRQKIKDTKEEAKKRIQKAKERVEAAESQLQSFKTAQNSSEDGAGKQAAIIEELRAEGESLAQKQADMEMAVRSAKGEARETREALERELALKQKALGKIELLESDLKETKENLAAARRGESMADKFEEQLRKAKEEDERKGSQILSLEQQLKELKTKARDLVAELEALQKGAAVESEQTVKKLRKELSDAVAEMENKLHKTEKDAQAREDALRREVDEIRKRWQDAVRRADSLSMDIQSSTAPLLRQLESAERQSRARAATAAEIETKLRSELEDTIVSKEKLTKERNEFKSKFSLLERSAKDSEGELKLTKQALGERIAVIKILEGKIEKLEEDISKKQEQWNEVERLANEGVSRVRSEMTQTVVDSEERHRSQLDFMKKELNQEREKRRQLEQQVSGLLENVSMLVPTSQEPALQIHTKPKKLKQSEGQAEILAGALGGLGRSHDADEDSDDDEGMLAHVGPQNGAGNSFAALAEMQSRMKATKQELEDLRKSLLESEKAKERLVIELRDGRNASEKLPLFEARCQELTEENRRLEMEVNVLTEEMDEMRLVYRSQLEAYLLSTSPTETEVKAQVDPSLSVEEEANEHNGDTVAS